MPDLYLWQRHDLDNVQLSMDPQMLAHALAQRLIDMSERLIRAENIVSYYAENSENPEVAEAYLRQNASEFEATLQELLPKGRLN